MVKPTDFETELAQTDKHLRELQHAAFAEPLDSEKATKFVYRLYHRASLSGNFSDFERAEAAIDRLIARTRPKEDLCLLKANLDFKFHRHAAVKRDFDMAPSLYGRFEGRSLKADLDFQEGRYEEARKQYEALIEEERTWDNLARLAYFKGKMGDVDAADALFVEAEDELTAKEMRSFAWVELQRGVLDVTRGKYDEALEHYRRAERAYSGFWFVDEHVAEVLAAQGKYDEAIALYQSVLSRVMKPEVDQALGELYRFLNKADLAQAHFENALRAFLESAEQGHVHYYHHLTELYANVYKNGPQAVRWARADLAVRENFATQGGLAWALYRDGQFAGALEWSDKALSSGVRDSHLFHQAAHINEALGRVAEHDELMRRSKAINPEHARFHVHH